ncbi:sugar ABC transporter ATP-binding protein [Clostridiales bacterium COT073_COT-073]|nr:sugar ABC transporter ATP-binding protein [Clostridiales bacterium COT073_COT-073]
MKHICILEGKNLFKEFQGNMVLKNASLQCFPGEGIALAGENGAGKSTLMNIISGGLKPTSGEIFIDGNKVILSGSKQGKQYGISFVHQELSLFKEMTVGENIMIGREPGRKRLIDQQKLHKKAKELLKEVGYEHIDVYALVKNISPAQKQITEIAKAWATTPRILIFDEPTSSLNKKESEILFGFINRIKKIGICVIVISHRLEDIFSTCDRVLVLKDGEFVFESSIDKTSPDQIISQMVGREFKNIYPPKQQNLNKEIALELREICMENKLKNINFKVPKGSVIGVGGLEGQGQRELSRSLFGIKPFTSGHYLIQGKEVQIKSPYEAVKNKLAFLSDDRKAEGLFMPLSTEKNACSLILNKLSHSGFISTVRMKNKAQKIISQLHIKVSDIKQPVSNLSGGNQQKIILSKWLETEPDVFILHEPTRGIDVQSKLEIYQLIRNLTDKGMSVIIFTSDMLELIGLSEYIYVLYEGEISGEIPGINATEEKIMRLSAKHEKDVKK